MPQPSALPASLRLAGFMRRWSLEAAHPTPAEIEALAATAPRGTEVYLTAVPGQSRTRVLAAAAGLMAAGLEPVPHLAARSFASVGELAAFLADARRAGVTRVLAVAGDRDAPAGPLADAHALIATGLLQRFGIRRIGIGGYPEGHPRIGDQALERARTDKLAAAAAAGLEAEIVTQFCFEPDAIVDWLGRLRAAGVDVPVKIGIAGPTSMTSLMRYAARCGVRASARGLARHASAARSLVGHTAPDGLVLALSDAAPALGPVSAHFYSFGGVGTTARYAAAAAAGTLPGGAVEQAAPARH